MKTVPAYLNTNPLLYAGLIQLYRRGTVCVLEEGADGVFIQDTHGISYMLAAADADLAVSWIKKHADQTMDVIMITGDDIADAVRNELHLPDRMDVYQAVYEKDTPPVYEHRLRIVPATEQDVPFIRAHYTNLDDAELQQVILHRQLFMGYDDKDDCAGFIGQHMEGSMGLLEILPAHRRRGYGAELESFMIGEMLRQGLIPYGQIKTDNHASRALQEKLGLRMAEGVITWLF